MVDFPLPYFVTDQRVTLKTWSFTWWKYMYWLVVWNIFMTVHSVGNVIIPTDFHIFQRDRSTTNQLWYAIICNGYIIWYAIICNGVNTCKYILKWRCMANIADRTGMDLKPCVDHWTSGVYQLISPDAKIRNLVMINGLVQGPETMFFKA